MLLKIRCEDPKIEQGVKIFCELFPMLDKNITIEAVHSEHLGKAVVRAEKQTVKIEYGTRAMFFRALFRYGSVGKTQGNSCAFSKLGIMLDCARNGVLHVRALKRYIVAAVALGYTYLGLYVEDCLEVQNEPHFGYMRGRYTEEEIREIVAYADIFGVEIVPYVQTLAHMAGLFRHWNPYYRDTRDCGDILLMDEPRVYTLIENIFATVERAFGRGRVNIGMDEAFFMTYGKYRELHGESSVCEVFARHVSKVCALAEKYGLSPEAWADMFMKHKDELSLPNNLTLRAWDYSGTTEDFYRNLLSECRALTDRVTFGTAVHKWYGYVPLNAYSKAVYESALRAAVGQTQDFCVTLWGDDGAECSPNAVWYALMDIANIANGNELSATESNAAADVLFGYSSEELLALDLPNKVFDRAMDRIVNPSKYVLFEDVFFGNADFSVSENFTAYFSKAKRTLDALRRRNASLQPLYETEYRLSAVLEKKCGLRREIRNAYAKRDREKLGRLAERLRECVELLTEFGEAEETLWLQEYKPFGLEIQQVRIGALKERLRYCQRVLKAYACGRTERIEELETEDLSPELTGDNYIDARCFNSYEQNISYCNISHKLYN